MTEHNQYSIFSLMPQFIFTDGSDKKLEYSLRDVNSSSFFSTVSSISGGLISSPSSPIGYGVRPRFLIG